MKKIAIASAAMGGAALIAFGASGTFAAFSDSESLRGEAGAATLDLVVGDGGVPVAEEAQNMAPGDTVTFPYFVQNAGDLDGYFGGKIDLTDYEHGCSGDEWDEGDTCGEAGDPGEFSRAAVYSVSYITGGTAEQCEDATSGSPILTDVQIPADAPNTLTVPAIVPVPANFSVCVVIEVTLPHTVDNTVQGDSAALDVLLWLDQVSAAR
ncbi:TasA family protein [Trujillonella endophytica]|uniref:Camelysin metallo-endopeptidase n=1 Tax=Trujillonella endophytica TaxID=673521 RepID=A0A1H8PHW2_9ACTN|nr:TasA family protein [Trujillella endophytica]SEO41361.1 Camelysin metallo-endopeptidase [Trujillella endophytica]